MNVLKKFSTKFNAECGTRSASRNAGWRQHSALRTPNSELKTLHERLWHFTSVGLGNCRAAQAVRREITQLRTAAVPGRSNVTSSDGGRLSSGPIVHPASGGTAPGDGRCPDQVLANQTLEQLTTGLAHLESVGLANSCAAQIVRGELQRRITLNSQLATPNQFQLANANFNPSEPRDQRGRWTKEGDTAASATNKPDQHITQLTLGAPASGHGATATNDPNRYLRNVSDSFASTLNAATNSPAQTNATTKPNDRLPDNGEPDAVELSIWQMLGRLLDRAGEEVRDTVAADWFWLIGDPQDALKQAGATSDQLKAMGFKDVEEDSGTTGEKPFEQGMQTLPPVPRAISRGAEGVVKSTPRLAIAEANPVAGALAFGTTSEGFDPKQAIIAAALPLVGKYSGEISAAMAARAGVSSETALQAFNKMGGAAGVTAVIGTDQLNEIMKLPPEKRKDALIEAAGTLGAMFILGMLGGAKRDSLGKWVDENGGGLSETDNIQRGQKAMDRAIRQKTDVQKAMYRKGIGQIDFKWGMPGNKAPDAQGRTYTEGEGISHILAKHPESLSDLPEAIAKGKIIPHDQEPDKRYIVYKDKLVVLKQENSGNAFVVTGFDDARKISELEKQTRPVWLGGMKKEPL